MGIGTLRRYHWKDEIQLFAEELKKHAEAIEELRNANELDTDKLEKISDEIRKTAGNIKNKTKKTDE